MGAFMIVAAFYAAWRNPILIFSALEKSVVVCLVLANLNRPYARGFWAGAAMDAVVVLYTVAYFMVGGEAIKAYSSRRTMRPS